MRPGAQLSESFMQKVDARSRANAVIAARFRLALAVLTLLIGFRIEGAYASRRSATR